MNNIEFDLIEKVSSKKLSYYFSYFLTNNILLQVDNLYTTNYKGTFWKLLGELVVCPSNPKISECRWVRVESQELFLAELKDDNILAWASKAEKYCKENGECFRALTEVPKTVKVTL